MARCPTLVRYALKIGRQLAGVKRGHNGDGTGNLNDPNLTMTRNVEETAGVQLGPEIAHILDRHHGRRAQC